MTLAEGEQLIHEGAVSAGWGRGWLILTDRRLVLLNRAKTRTLRLIDLADVRGVGRTANIQWIQAAIAIVPPIVLLLRNAIGVRLRDGRTPVFGASNPELWVDHIRRTCEPVSRGALGTVGLPYGKAFAVTAVGLVAGTLLVGAASGGLPPAGSSTSADAFGIAPAANAASPPSEVVSCTSPSTIEAIRNAVNRNGRDEVLDLGNLREVVRDPADGSVYCLGDIVTSAAAEKPIAVRLFFGPSGAGLVDVRDGLESFADKGPVRRYLLSQLQHPKNDDEFQLRQLLLAVEQSDREANMSPAERAADEERKRLSRERMAQQSAAEDAQRQTFSAEAVDEEPGFDPE